MPVTVDAHLRRQASAEGGGPPRRVLVVDRFMALGTGACASPSTTASLQDTYWKLRLLPGQTVAVAEPARGPRLVLAATARWRVDAGQLELLDAQGAPLARFEPVWLR